MTRRRMLLGRLAGVCLAAALCLGTAQGAVYDASTGYVRLLRNGTASVIPLTTNHVAEISGSTTNYLWSDHLAIHAGTNYYANMWFRGWNRNTRDPAVIYPIPCNRFVLDKASINWIFQGELCICHRSDCVQCSTVWPRIIRDMYRWRPSGSAA